MLLGRYGTFSGGIDLPDEKQETLDAPIQSYRPQNPLRIPLSFSTRQGARPVVQPGDRVEADQCIAVARSPYAVNIYAPLAGSVLDFTHASVAAAHGFVVVDAIEIAPDPQAYEVLVPMPQFDWRAAGSAALRERLDRSHLTTHRRPLMRLGRWVDHARSRSCDLLIANAMESQPFATAAHRMLIEHGSDIVRGLAILARAINAKDVFLAADNRWTSSYAGLTDPARIYEVNRIALGHKYPIGADPILAKVLGRREMPPGGTTMDVGCAVIGPAACLAVYRGVACQLPTTGRVVTVAGSESENSGNFYVPFGVSCKELAGKYAELVSHNGPMVGLACDEDAVVSPSTDLLLAMRPGPPKPPTPCIRCGWCTDHCPARLNVAALNDAFELAELSRARRLAAPACVECGVCSYVCPARLPLSQRVRQLKWTLLGIERAMPLFRKQRRRD